MFERNIRRRRHSESEESYHWERQQSLRKKLNQLELNITTLDLGHFVNRVNRLMETFVPEAYEVSKDDAFEFDRETILYYQEEGIIDRIGDEGWGDFGYRQVLQALLLKKMLVRGLPMRRIAFLMKGMEDEVYKRLLIGEIEDGFEESEEGFEREFRRSEAERSIRAATPVTYHEEELESKEQWVRVPILPGLEIHISNRFRSPRTEIESDSIMKMIKASIERRKMDRDLY